MLEFRRYEDTVINQNGTTEINSHLLKVGCLHVLSLELAYVDTRECTLHCENVWTAFQFFIETDTSCGLLGFLDSKTTGSKIEELTYF